MMMKKEGILLKCKCGNQWTYRGNKTINAVCTNCGQRVKIKQKD